MKQPDWYPAWRHDAFHELMDKIDVLKDNFGLSGHERYDYDLEKGTLLFSTAGVPRVIAEIQVVGTTATNAGNWLWSWANDWWPRSVVQAADATRRFGEEKGIEQLTSDYLYDDNLVDLGWEMAAVTARITGALGAYRPPTDKGYLFFVYTSMRKA